MPLQRPKQDYSKFEKHTCQNTKWRFWAVLPALCATTFLSALDTSIISTALPTIAKDLKSDLLYIWTINAYLLASTAVQPLYGQTANIFGRRWTMISSVVFFAIGSTLCGMARETTLMILGRSIQGIGGGGINALVDIVIADLVPMRERGKYVGMMGSMWALGSVAGPVLGGWLAQDISWRWIFWINLPLSAVSLVLLLFFLHVNYPTDDIWNKIRRVDYIGNLLLVSSVTSVLLALSWAGTRYSWSSWRTVVPLALGAVGMVCFETFQATSYCKEPTMPLRLFSNRTAASSYLLVFVQSILLYWVCYFLPVFFQAVKGHSATESGIDLLPISLSTAPLGIITGILIAVTGHYRVFHFAGYGLMSIAVGLISILSHSSPAQQWIVMQIIFGAGQGLVFSSTLPPIQASIPESDVATATATWAFVRSLGAVFGTSVPSSIFNFRVNQQLHLIPRKDIAASLANGGAYALASQRITISLAKVNPELANIILRIYESSLKSVWQISIAFALAGFLLALPVRSLTLRRDLDTEYGLTKEKLKSATPSITTDDLVLLECGCCYLNTSI